MPIYVCTAALGRLTPIQKAEIAQSITAIYHEVTGSPRYMVQVIFHDVAPGNQYVAGRPAPADQILIRCDTRSGKTSKQRTQMVRRIMQDVGRACGATEEAVTVLLCEIPVANIAEHGRVAPSPEEDDAWFSSLPDATRERLRRLA
jgi:phenylpyruvate tautomerase PptA (4-oxalocrotonate tautomerase family)